MQPALAQYELGREDYAWALDEIAGSRVERGAFGAARRFDRWWDRLMLWGPAAVLLVGLTVVAVFVALRFGATSTVTLAAFALAPLAAGLWIAGKWLWDRWELWGLDGDPMSDVKGAVLKRIDQGAAPLPMGRVEITWDQSGLRVSGGGNAVEVSWSARPTVRRNGDRALVTPFVPNLGMPDVARMAIVRSEAFPDRGAFEQAVAEWSSYAGG